MAQFTLVAELLGHTDRAWCVAWSPDGQLLASCSGDKTVRLWAPQVAAAASSNLVTSGLQNHGDEQATSAHILHPGTPITADGDTGPQGQADKASDEAARLVGSSWQCCAVLEEAHNRTVRAVSWSPDGRHLAMASFDATTSIWSRAGQAWEQVAVLEGHENEVKCVAWSPDGVHIATCGRDKSVWIWESLPGHEYECVDVKQGHQQDVKMVAWHPAGEQLVSCSYDDTIKTWASDGDEWVCTQTIAGSASGGPGHDSTVWSIAFNAAGTGMVSCGDDSTVRWWTAAAPASSSGPASSSSRPHWRHASTVSGYHSRTIFSVDWQRCGPQWVATGDGDNCVRVFAAVEGADLTGLGAQGVTSSWQQLGYRENAHDADVNCVRWHPHVPGLLATCGDDGPVRLWLVKPTRV